MTNNKTFLFFSGSGRIIAMKHSLKTGLSFGLTSGIITTLGLLVGLSSTTGSNLIVISGILTIAIADSFSDALGIHISEESENKHTDKEIWAATASTFLSKLFFALTFIVPVLLLPIIAATVVSIVWGLSMLGIFTYYIARELGSSPWKATMEHLGIAVLVIALAHGAGVLINLLVC